MLDQIVKRPSEVDRLQTSPGPPSPHRRVQANVWARASLSRAANRKPPSFPQGTIPLDL